MSFSAKLSQRCCQPEIMDQPDLDEQRHWNALRGLERINRWSGSARILWPAVRDLARAGHSVPLRILDLASGAGDVSIGLWRRARRAGLPVQVDGWDISPRAVTYARKRAGDQKAEVQFFQADALRSDIPDGYDVLVSSLFLHHLGEEEGSHLLTRMARAARRMVLINDLVRNTAGYLLAFLGTRILSASDVIHVDGPRSVAAAFTVLEALALAEKAGLAGATVARRWPCRWLLTWRKP